MADDYNRGVGLFIRNKRESISLSQVDCAKVTAIARSTLRDLEQGKRLPNGKELLSLSSVLKTTPNAILSASDAEASFHTGVQKNRNDIDMITSYAQLLIAFGALSRNSKELVKGIVFQLACSDLPASQRAQFIETYTKKLPGDLAGFFGKLSEGKEVVVMKALEEILSSYNGGKSFRESFAAAMEKYAMEFQTAYHEMKEKD